jgi:hypothetical protein
VTNNLVVNSATVATSWIGSVAGDFKTVFDNGSVGIGMDYTTGTLVPNTQLHVIGDDSTYDGTCQFASRKLGCPHQSHIHYGTSADWLIRSGSPTGTVKLQDSGGNVQIGNGGTSTVTLNGNLSTWLAGTCTFNLGTYLPSAGNAYNCSLTSTDDGFFGSSFAIKLKTSGAMANTQFTPLAISASGLTSLTQPPALSYTTVPTVGSSQIGYISQTTGGVTNATTSLSGVMCSAFIPNVGFYLFTFNATVIGTGSNALTLSLYSGNAATAGALTTVLTGFQIYASSAYSNTGSTVYVASINTSNSYVGLKCLTTTGTATVQTCGLQAIRIA